MVWESDCHTTSNFFLQTTVEAQFLANQVQLYYASRDQERYSLVHQFNHSPKDFDYSKIIMQLQNSEITLQKGAKSDSPLV